MQIFQLLKRLLDFQNITAKAQVPEKLTFVSKIKRFEEEIIAQNAASTSTKNGFAPPPKKPLISSMDLQKLQEDETRRLNNNTPSKHAEYDFGASDVDSTATASPSNEYEQMLNNM